MPYRNVDHHDRELLGVITDVAAERGYATAAEIAEGLGITNGRKDHRTPAQIIGPRLGAMRTAGFLDRRPERFEDDEGPFVARVWFLTDDGKEILSSKLSKSTESALGRLSPGQKLAAVQEITRTGYVNTDNRVLAIAMRRQIAHDLGQRRTPLR